MSWLGSGAGAEVSATSVSGAGNSSVPLMKQTGYGQGSPPAPPLGNGGTRISATMFRTMIAPMNRNQRWDSPRPVVGLGSGAGASAAPGVMSCSLDTLAPHTGA